MRNEIFASVAGGKIFVSDNSEFKNNTETQIKQQLLVILPRVRHQC